MPKNPITPETRVLDEYYGSMSLEKELGGRTAFDEWQQKRLNAVSIFQTTRLPGADEKSDTLETLMNRAAPHLVQQIKRQFEGAFTLPAPQAAAAHTQFDADLTHIDAAIRAVPYRFDLRNVPALMALIQEDALNAIKADQAAELQQLKAALDPRTAANFTAIEQAFRVDSRTAKDIAATLVKTLESSHKQQIEQFENKMKTAVQEVNQQIGKERTRIALLRDMAERHKDLATEIARLSAKRNNPPQTTVLAGAPTHRFRGIKPSELQGLVTVTGRGIKQDGKEFRLATNNFSDSLKSLWYRLQGENKDMQDIMSLAATLRAEGITDVTMTVRDAPDQDAALRLARQSYEACILAGYPPDKITVKWVDLEGKTNVFCGQSEDPKITQRKPASEMLYTGALVDVLEAIHNQGTRIRDQEKEPHFLNTAQLRDHLQRLRETPPAPPASPAIPTR